ncbi:MAG: hypothetical protein RI959_1385 [Pseudomonadota bacterium]
MKSAEGYTSTQTKSANQMADGWLHTFAVLVLPVLVVIMSVWALSQWQSDYKVAEPGNVGFRAVEQSDGDWSPSKARAQLLNATPVTAWDTRLSETPIWFSTSLPPRAPAVPGVTSPPVGLDFPSRHNLHLDCWDADTLAPLGNANRDAQTGRLQPSRAGFALVLMPEQVVSNVLCKAQFMGPARLTVQLWPLEDLKIKQQEFHRNSGLLEGGMLVLAAFMLIAGLINRNSHYMLFAAWLVVNLRMAALSAGWDTQWLGHSIPADWLPTLRAVTLALFYGVTYSLFRALFADQLQRLNHPWPLTLAKWISLPLPLLALALPYKTFLPVIWVSTGVGVVILVYLLVRILFGARNWVAIWYASSIAITLFASLYEVVAASLGLQGLIGTFNSVTAALTSSLLTSLAIAEQMREAHASRLAAQAELEHTYEVVPVGLFTLDTNGCFLSANPALETLLNAPRLAQLQAPWDQHFGNGAWHAMRALLAHGKPIEMELSLAAQSPSADPTALPGKNHYWLKATMAGETVEGSLQDVTDKVLAKERLEFLANHDPLTKALNRRGIEAVYGPAQAKSNQEGPMALAYLDLDRFKLINDLYGHNAGDEVLQQVCARVMRPLSHDMHLGRIGGDEFVIVMINTPLAQAEWVCREIISSLSATPYMVGERAFHIRGSIGLIELAPATTYKDAIATADRACREAKKGHSAGLVTYQRDSRVFSDHEAEMQLVERLSNHESIAGLFLEMQPIMSLRTPYASLNFEVLLRMKDEHGDRIPTERLIHAGEDSGRMGVIDRWVLSSTLEWLAAHVNGMPSNQFVCMNLSGASLNDEKFMEDVFVMLARSKNITQRLCLEITESVALHDLGNTRRFIDKVRSFGAMVALDDFGAGYTSFSYLKDLPADVLKIDGSFIVNMNRHPANVAIVEAIVSLAQNLGMKTIAEWAEDFETVETLAEIGVDYVQGFVVARPQSPDLIAQAQSGADFIADDPLKQYLQTLSGIADPFPGVDLVLGAEQRNP